MVSAEGSDDISFCLSSIWNSNGVWNSEVEAGCGSILALHAMPAINFFTKNLKIQTTKLGTVRLNSLEGPVSALWGGGHCKRMDF